MREDPRTRHTKTIRRFRAQDVDFVMAVLHESPEAASWSRDSFLEATEEPGSLALVLEDRSEPTGFLIGRLVRDQAEVLNLAVLRRHRRAGCGSALLEAALSDFRSNGAESVYLEVRESNTPAIGFYERLGFSKVGRRKEYYQDPVEAAVTMARKLKA